MKKIKGTIILLGVFALGLGLARSVSAQTFSLSPQSASKTVGEDFTVDLNIDTESKAVAGADVKITYDADTIEMVRVVNGDFFSEGANNISAGRLYVAGFFSEQFKTKTGTGKVATLTVKGKKAGSVQLIFVCTAQTNDSNILDASANDIANCSAIRNGTYTFSESSSSSPTSTPTPTPTGSSSYTPTPTPPVSGVALPTILSVGVGFLLTIIGLAVLF